MNEDKEVKTLKWPWCDFFFMLFVCTMGRYDTVLLKEALAMAEQCKLE